MAGRTSTTTPPDSLTWPERIESLRRAFKREPFLTYVDGDRPWLYGVWLQGSFARNADYWGAYPGDLLLRYDALFPDRRRVLHLFSGRVDLRRMPGDTLDILPELSPTYCCNAETCKNVPLESYDLVVADPPYTPADAAQYGDGKTPMVVPGRVMTALTGLSAGARVLWLDERVPTYTRNAFVHEGIIGLSTSAGHRFRVISIFRGV